MLRAQDEAPPSALPFLLPPSAYLGRGFRRAPSAGRTSSGVLLLGASGASHHTVKLPEGNAALEMLLRLRI